MSGTSVTVPDTNYAIPAGARYVATSGSDTGTGSSSSPWRTIQHAIGAATSGETVVVRGGTYRESLTLYNKTLTIQAYPHEQVWVKGSVVVSGWVQDGSIWRKDGWSFRVPHLVTPSGYIDPAYPMAGYPDMVFLDGAALAQVSSKAQVSAGRFYLDEASSQLYIGDNPTGRTVEAAAQRNLLQLYNASDSKILGLGFAHAASQTDSAGSALIVNTSNRVLIENNAFAWNAGSGMEVGQASDDVVVRQNQLVYNSLVGATSWGGPKRLRFSNNYIAANNQERFSIHWAAAGVKFNNIVDSVVSDNVVENNLATGIWCDNSCINVNIVRNISRNNTFMGIMYEISDGAIIASNLVTNNASVGGMGVYVSESTNAKVYNNTIADNLIVNARSIDVNSNSRKTTTGVEIVNNIMSHSANSSLWVARIQDDLNRTSASSLVPVMDNNAYYRMSSSWAAPIQVRWGEPTTPVDYATLSAFRSGESMELNGLAVDNQSVNPFFVDEAGGNYHLKAGSAALASGKPLPADVAAAIGVTAGTAVDRGMLVWPPGTTAPPSSTTTTTSTTVPATTTTVATSSGARFHPVTPSRLLDTRLSSGALGAGGKIDLQASGKGGVPATGVSAVILNVTVTEPTAPSFLTVYPTGESMPTASNLNFVAGETVPNLVTAKVGSGGRVSIYNSAGATQVVVDVAGWFDAP